MAFKKSDILVAKRTFSVQAGGRRHIFRKGKTRIRAAHPLVAGREHLFEPIVADYDIEQTTAAPGEKRAGTRALKKDG